MPRPEPADGAILDARVVTLDPARPAATALAWRGGSLVAVGDGADVERHLGAATRVFDGRGLVVVPGLVDAHIHPFHGTLQTRGIDLGRAYTLDEVRAALRAERARLDDGGWLLAHTARYEPFHDGGITADAIDDVVAGAPALLNFFDGHTALASTEALHRAGVTGPREFVENAEVVCDPAGRPTGALLELGAMAIVRQAVPEWTPAERLDAYARTLRALNAVGITGAHVMIGGPHLLEECRRLEERGDLTVRAVLPMHLDPSTPEDEVVERLRFPSEHGRLWRSGTAKFFLDGVLENGTAWQVEPGPNGVNGAPFWEDLDRYDELVRRFTTAGFSCITHAVGDGAVQHALDAYEAAGPPVRGMHRVEHIETLLDVDLPRFAGLGIAASMQPLHMAGLDRPGPSAWLEGLAPGRAERGFRCADILHSGAVFALGSDWMVADFDPRVGMAWARLRREPGAPGNRAFLPDQALTGSEVLHGYTTGPARIDGSSDQSGRLTAGRHADVTVMSADPGELDPDDLASLSFHLTVVDGEVVHRDPAVGER